MGYDVFFNCLNSENAPKRKKGGWFDIPLPYDLYFEAGEVVKIVFDLRVKMPVGYEAIIQPRSSTLEKTGLISSGFGVVEDSYCGEDDYIGYRFYATKDGLVSAGSCLVQMRFQKKMENCFDQLVPDCFFTGVESRGGFGSTDDYDPEKGTKEDLAKKVKTRLSNMYGKSCTENEDYNQLDEANKNDYELGFSQGFDEGHMEGYDEGFRDGYDMATEGPLKNFDANSIIKAQRANTGDFCPFNLWNYNGLARCICLSKSNNSCGVIINENCPFRKKGKNA